MTEALSLAAETLTSPMLLFFALGAAVALIRSEIAMPEPVSKALSLYLLFVIGLKGGASVAAFGVDARFLAALGAGVLLSFMMPLLAFAALRAGTGLGRVDAAAVAAHYGSISIVTFAAMAAILRANGVFYEGWMVAVAAVMEAPAILMALLIARGMVDEAAPVRAGAGAVAGGGAGGRAGGGAVGGLPGPQLGEMVRHALLDRAMLLLFGAFLLGWAAGEAGAGFEGSVIERHFPAVLCLFLLDQGLAVGRKLHGALGHGRARRIDRPLVLFAIAMPLVGAGLGLLAGASIGLAAGGMALLAVLAASASTLAVPAAMRAALPEADPQVYLTLSLCVSFPFNLIVGLPIYLAAAVTLAG